MKTHSVRYLLCVLLMGLAQAGAAQEPLTIKIAFEDWPPWMIATPEGGLPGGAAVDLLNEAMQQMGIQGHYINLPFVRALKELDKGSIDLLMLVARSPDRDSYMVFSDAVLNQRTLFCYSNQRNAGFSWSRLEDLARYKVGITRGYTYSGRRAAIVRHAKNVEDSVSDEQSLIRLMAGRVDVAVFFESTLPAFLTKYPQAKQELRCHAKALMETQLHFGISKKSALLAKLPRFNRVIGQINVSHSLLERISPKP
ncbi:MAG TPA: transporter substrate-binding domain-containing protein [Pseudomonas sp.]|nr:transporter substrate-binding domain-containing protein [Pseudomonas sp.]